MYSKAYQQVIAGRVRENEQLSFFGKNKIGTPAGVFQIDSKGGQTQPTIKINILGSSSVGKPEGPTKEDKSAYNEPGYGAGKV